MNPPTDNQFHDRVRRTLHDYRPAYDPQNWQQMQQKLQRQRWRLRALVSFGVLFILLIASWVIVPMMVPKTSVTTLQPARPARLPESDKPVVPTRAPVGLTKLYRQLPT